MGDFYWMDIFEVVGFALIGKLQCESVWDTFSGLGTFGVVGSCVMFIILGWNKERSHWPIIKWSL